MTLKKERIMPAIYKEVKKQWHQDYLMIALLFQLISHSMGMKTMKIATTRKE